MLKHSQAKIQILESESPPGVGEQKVLPWRIDPTIRFLFACKNRSPKTFSITVRQKICPRKRADILAKNSMWLINVLYLEGETFSERAESFSDDFHSFVVTPSKPNRDAKNSVDISKKIQKIEILSLKSMNRSLDLCVNADLALVLFFDDGSSISFLAANTVSDGINFYPDGPIPQKDFPDGYFLDFSGEGFLVDEERRDIYLT
jgi:hypothetical protein